MKKLLILPFIPLLVFLLSGCGKTIEYKYLEPLDVNITECYGGLCAVNGWDNKTREMIADLEKRIKVLEDKPEITKYKVLKDIPHSVARFVMWDEVGDVVEWIKEEGVFCRKCSNDEGWYSRTVFNNERNCYTKKEIQNKEFFKPID